METVEVALKQARQSIDFDVDSISQFLYGLDNFNVMKKQYPKWNRIPYNWNTYNEGRVAILKEAYKNQPMIYNSLKELNESQLLYLFLSSNHQMPGSVSPMMFIKCIEYMGSEQQKQRFLKKSINFEIVGCYAQTEIGHGSDVRGLETTATFDQKAQEFVIHSPSISAAKYWPGQLGLCANWALVYAQLLIKGKNFGVQAFFVPLRDHDYNPLPGIQAGDIGPKLGYHAKQNGYMMLNNVRIPRQNMLGKYSQVTPDGKYITKPGDPRIAYATMMKIRLLISTLWPKVYGQLITTVTRYSFFRKQFKDKYGIEKPIISYQTQQEKVISRVAQFYAIVNAGHSITQLALKNQELIKQGDSSLMQQTHIVLCFSKALYSQIVLQGMQICRKACGGHGYSHYAGFTAPLGQFYTNPTHEGQNTVLYLQVAKYVMKSYQKFATTRKPLLQSVKYIEQQQTLQSYKRTATSPQDWVMQDFTTLLHQACLYLVKKVATEMMSKPQEVSNADMFNYFQGSNLQKLAILNGYAYTYKTLGVRLNSECTNDKNKQILNDLYLLFGCNITTSSMAASEIISAGALTRQQVESIYALKQQLIQRIRPRLIGLVDAFCIPQHLVRSELTYGNPYENYLKQAKQCSINKKIPQSVFVVKEIHKSLVKAKL